MMNKFFYNVSFTEYENLKLKTSNNILIQTTCDISQAEMENFIKRKLNIARSNVLMLESIERINEATFLLLGDKLKTVS